MKKSITVAAALLLANSSLLGQSVTPNLAKRAKALLFTFGGFSNLSAGSFEGGVGVKYYYKDKLGIRAGLQFASASAEIPANAPTGVQGIDGERSATRFGVTAALEFHKGAGRVSPYLGGGLGFSTTSTETKLPSTGNPPPDPVTVKNDRNGENINGIGFLGGTNLNVFALAGVEFFLFNEVSIAAEYRLGFTNLARADEERTISGQTTTTKIGGSSNLGITNSGLLTLAIYF
jgi:opacity protein-like surface antigen